MIKYNSIFRLQRYQVVPFYRKLFRSVKKLIKSEYGVDSDFRFDSDVAFGEASTDCSVLPVRVNIGVRGLFDGSNSLSDDFSDLRFICPIIAVFHESEHICQFSRQNLQDCVTDEDVELSVSGLSRIGNDLYYKMNYLSNLREIRAA